MLLHVRNDGSGTVTELNRNSGASVKVPEQPIFDSCLAYTLAPGTCHMSVTVALLQL